MIASDAKSSSKILYETPPNFSLFGDQWHFMTRALNFNAVSPFSRLFRQHTPTVSAIEKLAQSTFSGSG